MGTGRNRLIAEPGLQVSQVTRADIEALRASDRLQQIFDSGVRSQAGARPALAADDIVADGEDEPVPDGRQPRGRRRVRFVVGLAAACLGAFVLADDLARLTETVPMAVIAGSEVAETQAAAGAGSIVATTPAAAPREQGGGAEGTGEASPAPRGVAKASGELIKRIGSAAMIRRAIRGDAGPWVAAGGTAEPVEPRTLPQPSWPAEAALPVPRPVGPVEPVAPQGERDLSPAGAAPAAPPSATPVAAAPIRASELPHPILGPLRIVLHYRGADGQALARRLASALQAQGATDTELREVSIGVADANVRFFHDENQAEAMQVRDLIRSLGYSSKISDFTHFSPSPSFGTIEVWLPG